MPPESWSRSCLREVDGWVAPELWTQETPQQGATEASGCELWRIIRDPGKVVTIAAGATGHELQDTWNVTDNCSLLSSNEIQHSYPLILVPSCLNRFEKSILKMHMTSLACLGPILDDNLTINLLIKIIW